jgi:hypothetical protein
VPSRFAKIVALLAAVQLLGGHWMALQGVAWTQMLVKYAQDAPFMNAVSKTFGGEHPCKVCKLVKQGRATEEKTAAVESLLKVDAVLSVQVALEAPRPQPVAYATFLAQPSERPLAPPTPPPLA